MKRFIVRFILLYAFLDISRIIITNLNALIGFSTLALILISLIFGFGFGMIHLSLLEKALKRLKEHGL